MCRLYSRGGLEHIPQMSDFFLCQMGGFFTEAQRVCALIPARRGNGGPSVWTSHIPRPPRKSRVHVRDEQKILLIFATVASIANARRAAEPRYAHSEGGEIVETVRLNHLRAALLTAAAGLLTAVGLVVVLYAQPAEANYPGKPAKIAFSGYDGHDSEIYTIKASGGG